VTLSGPVPRVHHAVQRETYFRGDFRGSGGVFANRPINLSAAEHFSSAPISRAFSMKALDCSGSSGFPVKVLLDFGGRAAVCDTLSPESLYPPPLNRLKKIQEHNTFNHGVEGSSPSALTNEIRHNLNFSAKTDCVCSVSAKQLPPSLLSTWAADTNRRERNGPSTGPERLAGAPGICGLSCVPVAGLASNTPRSRFWGVGGGEYGS
jgi:hypothetical protein